MPKVNRVGEKQTITAADVGTVDAADLVSRPNSVGSQVAEQVKATPVENRGLLNLPAFLTKSDDSYLPVVAQSELTGYAGFADSASKSFPQMQVAGLVEGDPFIMQDGQYVKCNPLEYVLLTGKSYRTRMVGQEGNFVWVSTDVDNDNGDSYNHQPHYVILMLVKVGNQLVPIKADFRGTKSGGADKAVNAVKAAATTEWPSLSDAHKVSCAFHQPWGRVWNTVTTSRHVGKTSGNAYYRANCRSVPTNASQIQLLFDSFADPLFTAQVEKSRQNFMERCKFLDEIAAKTGDKA